MAQNWRRVAPYAKADNRHITEYHGNYSGYPNCF